MNGKYRLRWQPSISRDMLEATSRVDPATREAILAAIADVEAVLESRADTAGESRDPGERLLISSPLSVSFSVNTRLREVFIFQVRVFKTQN